MTSKPEPTINDILGIVGVDVEDLGRLCTELKNLSLAIADATKESGLVPTSVNCSECNEVVATEADALVSSVDDIDYYVSGLDDSFGLIDLIANLEQERDYWKAECESRLDEAEVAELEQMKIVHRLKHGQ